MLIKNSLLSIFAVLLALFCVPSLAWAEDAWKTWYDLSLDFKNDDDDDGADHAAA